MEIINFLLYKKSEKCSYLLFGWVVFIACQNLAYRWKTFHICAHIHKKKFWKKSILFKKRKKKHSHKWASYKMNELSKVGDCSWGRPEGSLFNSYYIKM